MSILGPGITLVPGTAAGVAMVVEPSVSARLFYDDNAALTIKPHDFSAGSELLGALRVSRETAAMKLQGIARLNMLVDAGGDVYRDKDNQLLSLAFTRKGEVSRWKLNGSWRRDSIIRSVSVIEDMDENVAQDPDDDVDAGLVHVSVRRNRFVLKPSWSYRFSPRSEVNAGYGFDRVTFGDTRDTSLSDYENQSLFGSYFYRITERDQITTTLGMSQYRTDSINRDYDGYNALVGLKHSYSETASGHFQIGWQETSYSDSFGSRETSNYLFRISGEKRTGLMKFSLRLSRSTFASGAGDVVNSDVLLFNMSRELSEKMRFSLRMKAFQNESIREDSPAANRRYMSIAPTLVWKITPYWSADASYRYRRQKRDTDARSAESNAVYLSLRYSYPTQF